MCRVCTVSPERLICLYIETSFHWKNWNKIVVSDKGKLSRPISTISTQVRSNKWTIKDTNSTKVCESSRNSVVVDKLIIVTIIIMILRRGQTV